MPPHCLRSKLNSLAAALVFALCTLGAGDALAQEPLHLGVGGKVGVNANLITPPAIIAEPNPPIPAFLGSGGGVGVAADLLYADIVGVSVEMWTVSATGRGRYTFVSTQGSYSVDQKLSTSELQFPLLARAQLPLKYVQPFVAFGPTFVVQTEATWSVDAEVTTEIIDPEPAVYTMLTGSIGLNIEIDQIKIPIEFRGNWSPLERDPRARARYEYDFGDEGGLLTRMSVNSTWEAQLWVMVGVQYWQTVEPW